MASIRRTLAVAALGLFLPATGPSDRSDAAAKSPEFVAGYVEDGEYRASYEIMDLSPPVSWLTDWMFA